MTNPEEEYGDLSAVLPRNANPAPVPGRGYPVGSVSGVGFEGGSGYGYGYGFGGGAGFSTVPGRGYPTGAAPSTGFEGGYVPGEGEFPPRLNSTPGAPTSAPSTPGISAPTTPVSAAAGDATTDIPTGLPRSLGRRQDDPLVSDEEFFSAAACDAARDAAHDTAQPGAGTPGVQPAGYRYEDPRARMYPNSMITREFNAGRPQLALNLPWYFELIAVVITVLAISSLVRAYLLQPFYIPSKSMEPTLMVNDSVLVAKTAPRYRDLNRGDIVVFKDAENWLNSVRENVGRKSQQNPVIKGIKSFLVFVGLVPQGDEGYLIKRVIGLGNDNVACCDEDGKMTVNGKALDENYTPNTGSASDIEFDVTVPQNGVWVMGDNRNHSADSRSHMNLPSGGFIPLKNVVGRAFMVIWPLEHMRIISASCAFYNIPKPVEGVEDSFSSQLNELAR